jgi:hypothetical protein
MGRGDVVSRLIHTNFKRSEVTFSVVSDQEKKDPKE